MPEMSRARYGTIINPLASVDELAVTLRGKFTPEQEESLQRCIDAATAECLDWIDPYRELGADWDAPQQALANRVCLARAVEWYKANDALFGVIGTAEIGALRAPRDGFSRHAMALGPLKEHWGLA